MPSQYIFEPWKAPLHVQEQAGCIVGRDYPHRVVDHDVVSQANMGRMKVAYANQPRPDGANDNDGGKDGRSEEGVHSPSSKRNTPANTPKKKSSTAASTPLTSKKRVATEDFFKPRTKKK